MQDCDGAILTKYMHWPFNNLSISNTVIFKLTIEFSEVKQYVHPPAGSGTAHTKSVGRNWTPMNAPPVEERLAWGAIDKYVLSVQTKEGCMTVTLTGRPCTVLPYFELIAHSLNMSETTEKEFNVIWCCGNIYLCVRCLCLLSVWAIILLLKHFLCTVHWYFASVQVRAFTPLKIQ